MPTRSRSQAPQLDIQGTLQACISRGQAATHIEVNLVTVCGAFDGRKACRTQEAPGMYLPYVPSRFEYCRLAGRHIRADVHDWLASRLPKGSRLS